MQQEQKFAAGRIWALTPDYFLSTVVATGIGENRYFSCIGPVAESPKAYFKFLVLILLTLFRLHNVYIQDKIILIIRSAKELNQDNF